MRGMLEDESTTKRKEMLKAMQMENEKLVRLIVRVTAPQAKEKKMREVSHKKEELEQEYKEVAYSYVPYGQKDEMPATFEEFAKTKGIISPIKTKK